MIGEEIQHKGRGCCASMEGWQPTSVKNAATPGVMMSMEIKANVGNARALLLSERLNCGKQPPGEGRWTVAINKLDS